MLIVTIMVIITISTGCATPKRPNSPLATPLNRPNSVASRPYHVNLKQARHPNSLRVTVCLLLGATLIVVLAARIRLLGLPLERDEGEYAYTGQLLLQGIPPYQLAYSMKFPGTSVAYALLMSIFGDSITAIHGGLILINLLTAGLILFLGRNILGELGGSAAAAAYCVLSLMPNVLGLAAHATHFVVMFAVAGTLLLSRSLDRQSRTLIFASGSLFGFALLMKQPGLFFVLFGSVYLFSRDWRAQLKARDIVVRNLIFLSSASVPFLVSCLAFWKAGVFEKFWFWTIKYAGHYGSQVSIAEGFRLFAGHFWGALGTAWPIWSLAAIGAIVCVVKPTLRSRSSFLLKYDLFFELSVCP